jgi:hypothetical protein
MVTDERQPASNAYRLDKIDPNTLISDICIGRYCPTEGYGRKDNWDNFLSLAANAPKERYCTAAEFISWRDSHPDEFEAVKAKAVENGGTLWVQCDELRKFHSGNVIP